jgi:hypothetical protein
MKNKFAHLQLGSIKELSKQAQREIKGGGGPNSPCCPTSPYYNLANCEAYKLSCKSFCEPYNCG